MARLWSTGFELNSSTSGIEYDTNGGTKSTVVSSLSNGGSYSNKINITSSGNVTNIHKLGSVSQYATIYARFYLYITTLPGTASPGCRIFELIGNNNVGGNIKLASDGTIHLIDKAANDIGSTAIGSNAWNYIEIFNDASPASGSRVLTGKLNGTQFATSSNRTSAQVIATDGVQWGETSNNTTLTIYFDDIGFNDNSGSFQNSYLGAGKIIHLRPSAAGDSTQWSPDSGSNYARVQEVTPDDITSYVQDSVLNDSDLYNVDDSGIGANDTVNVVSVGGRFRNDVADATASFKFHIEKTSGGTLSKSSAIVPNSTTWKTNAIASPFVYPITLYQDPDSSNWTQTTLDSMQIGVESSLANVNKNQVSTVWALVDYTPATGDTVSTSDSSTITDQLDGYSDTIATREQVTVQIAASSDLNVTVTDTIGSSESITLMVESYINKSETIATTDTPIEMVESYINKSDTISTTELVVRMADENIAISDLTSITENTPLFIPFYNIIVSDTINTSENWVVSTGSVSDLSVNVNDATSLSEFIGRLVTNFISVIDTIGSTDTTTLLITNLIITLSDSVNVSDADITNIPGFSASVNIQENVGISESYALRVIGGFWYNRKNTTFESDNHHGWETPKNTTYNSDNHHGWYDRDNTNWEDQS